MSKSEAWDKAKDAIDRVRLTPKSDTKTGRLSGGELRRVGLAASLVHNAQVLLLDEPTASLDPEQRRNFRETLLDISSNTTVLMSTHDVVDLAEEAAHIAVMNTGKLLHFGVTESFLDFAPKDTAPGRRAEGAYSMLLSRQGAL
jgi:ABC-type multidrug transport system ATPase subunit